MPTSICLAIRHKQCNIIPLVLSGGGGGKEKATKHDTFRAFLLRLFANAVHPPLTLLLQMNPSAATIVGTRHNGKLLAMLVTGNLELPPIQVDRRSSRSSSSRNVYKKGMQKAPHDCIMTFLSIFLPNCARSCWHWRVEAPSCLLVAVLAWLFSIVTE